MDNDKTLLKIFHEKNDMKNEGDGLKSIPSKYDRDDWFQNLCSEIYDMTEVFLDWKEAEPDNTDIIETQFARQLIWKLQDNVYMIRRDLRHNITRRLKVISLLVLLYAVKIDPEGAWENDARLCIMYDAIKRIIGEDGKSIAGEEAKIRFLRANLDHVRAMSG